jgi:Fe2+ transport system protein B
MDKQAISGYIGIVIVAIVLVVLFALATPFGVFVKDNTQYTAEGMMDVSQNAINDSFNKNLGVTVADIAFEEVEVNK